MRIIDGDYTRVQQVSLPVFEEVFPGTGRECWKFRVSYNALPTAKPNYVKGTPWSGSTVGFPHARTNPNTTVDDTFRLQEIGPDQDVGDGTVTWELTYWQRPFSYVLPEPYSFDYPSYFQTELDEARSKVPANASYTGLGRKAIQWQGISYIIKDYFYTNDPTTIQGMGNNSSQWNCKLRSGMDLGAAGQTICTWTEIVPTGVTIEGYPIFSEVNLSQVTTRTTEPTPAQYAASGYIYSSIDPTGFVANDYVLCEAATITNIVGNIWERTIRIIPHK